MEGGGGGKSRGVREKDILVGYRSVPFLPFDSPLPPPPVHPSFVCLFGMPADRPSSEAQKHGWGIIKIRRPS